MDALVAEALAQNPELAFYEAELEAARAGVLSARPANPEWGGTFGRKQTETDGLEDEGTAWSVTVSQAFEWPGRIGLRKSIANRDIALAELGLERFRTALAARVRELAQGLDGARELASAASDVAQRFIELRDVVVQRDAAGLTPLLEMRVIEATALAMQRKAADATIAARSALWELNQLRGVAPDTEIRIDGAPYGFVPAVATETLLAAARTNNFDVRLRAAELEQQGFRVKLAKSERYPSITVDAAYEEEEAGGEEERFMGVGISIPLPLWDQNQGAIGAEVARRKQAEASLHLVIRDVERRVLEAALTYEARLREMAAWPPDSIARFHEAAELADRHYRLGAVPVTTYVELQQQYLDAVEAFVEARNAALTAALTLEELTGMPHPWN
jgi:cobalt-zinc-cadmium efflux system outer membrane protein